MPVQINCLWLIESRFIPLKRILGLVHMSYHVCHRLEHAFTTAESLYTKLLPYRAGGLMDFAYYFIIQNGGIDTEKDYAYNAVQGQCNINKEDRHVVTIDSYEDVPPQDEGALEKASYLINFIQAYSDADIARKGCWKGQWKKTGRCEQSHFLSLWGMQAIQLPVASIPMSSAARIIVALLQWYMCTTRSFLMLTVHT